MPLSYIIVLHCYLGWFYTYIYIYNGETGATRPGSRFSSGSIPPGTRPPSTLLKPYQSTFSCMRVRERKSWFNERSFDERCPSLYANRILLYSTLNKTENAAATIRSCIAATRAESHFYTTLRMYIHEKRERKSIIFATNGYMYICIYTSKIILNYV